MEQWLQLIVSIIRMGHNSTRLYVALSSIVILLKNKLEYMHSLLLPSQSSSNSNTWLWQCVVRYSVDQERGQQDAIEIQKCSFSTIPDDSSRSAVRGKVSVVPAYCRVEVAYCNCWYDYEYNCPTQLMITSGHTEQSLAKLLITFHHYYNGLLWGPAGSGKSELVQHIAMVTVPDITVCMYCSVTVCVCITVLLLNVTVCVCIAVQCYVTITQCYYVTMSPLYIVIR